jgi:hypothetical protein
MDQYVLVHMDNNIAGSGLEQYLIVDTQASPMKVVAVTESAAVGGPIVNALNGV